jgi:hypothetical protein
LLVEVEAMEPGLFITHGGGELPRFPYPVIGRATA